jgi:hypothetical protein
MRGGAYNTTSFLVDDLSSRNRRFSSPTTASNNVGFRICSLYPLPSVDSGLEWILIPGLDSSADFTGYGRVLYNFYISKYLITNEQYAEFLLSVAATDTYSLYNINMYSNSRGGINLDYSIKTISGVSMANKPVNYISWFRAARYCNWLHNNKPSGAQNTSSTEDGSYVLNGALSGVSIEKNIGAKFWIPSEDEWYKAAYYFV